MLQWSHYVRGFIELWGGVNRNWKPGSEVTRSFSEGSQELVRRSPGAGKEEMRRREGVTSAGCLFIRFEIDCIKSWVVGCWYSDKRSRISKLNFPRPALSLRWSFPVTRPEYWRHYEWSVRVIPTAHYWRGYEAGLECNRWYKWTVSVSVSGPISPSTLFIFILTTLCQLIFQ